MTTTPRQTAEDALGLIQAFNADPDGAAHMVAGMDPEERAGMIATLLGLIAMFLEHRHEDSARLLAAFLVVVRRGGLEDGRGDG